MHTVHVATSTVATYLKKIRDYLYHDLRKTLSYVLEVATYLRRIDTSKDKASKCTVTKYSKICSGSKVYFAPKYNILPPSPFLFETKLYFYCIRYSTRFSHLYLFYFIISLLNFRQHNINTSLTIRYLEPSC